MCPREVKLSILEVLEAMLASISPKNINISYSWSRTCQMSLKVLQLGIGKMWRAESSSCHTTCSLNSQSRMQMCIFCDSSFMTGKIRIV